MTIHTGNWGCGAFTGNVEMMATIQILAAAAASVEWLVFHTVEGRSNGQTKQALRWAQESLHGKREENLGTIFDLLVKRQLPLSLANGT